MKIRCIECGEANDGHTNFCINCGRQLKKDVSYDLAETTSDFTGEENKLLVTGQGTFENYNIYNNNGENLFRDNNCYSEKKNIINSQTDNSFLKLKYKIFRELYNLTLSHSPV